MITRNGRMPPEHCTWTESRLLAQSAHGRGLITICSLLASSDGRVLTFKLRHALQAECLPIFESIVGRSKRFPTNVIDVSQLFRRKTVQVVEAIKSERYVTGLANKQMSHNRETPPRGGCWLPICFAMCEQVSAKSTRPWVLHIMKPIA